MGLTLADHGLAQFPGQFSSEGSLRRVTIRLHACCILHRCSYIHQAE